jgi:hypothetical protein
VWGARREGRGAHTRVTRPSRLQVTWNQVQGLTSVGSQLWSTPRGSARACRSAYSASPSELDADAKDAGESTAAAITSAVAAANAIDLARVRRGGGEGKSGESDWQRGLT